LIQLLIAAAVASAAPAAPACPDVVTPDAAVCRALEAKKNGNEEAAARGFEEAAQTAPDKDPATAAMNHSPLFFADESALPIGVKVMTNLALDYLFGGK